MPVESYDKLASQMKKLKADRKDLESKVVALKERENILAEKIMERMKKDGTDSVRTKNATMHILTAQVPVVNDWDDFYKFMIRKKWLHLLERRPSVTGCRELFESGAKIPGVEPYERVTLGFRKPT